MNPIVFALNFHIAAYGTAFGFVAVFLVFSERTEILFKQSDDRRKVFSECIYPRNCFREFKIPLLFIFCKQARLILERKSLKECFYHAWNQQILNQRTAVSQALLKLVLVKAFFCFCLNNTWSIKTWIDFR